MANRSLFWHAIIRVHVVRLSLSTILFICLAINHSVFAQSACQNDVFGHSGIMIDRTAETANEAQRLSLQEAHKSALALVTNRLLLDGQNLPFDVAPESLVELVHIRTETSLPSRYIAEIDICFSPDQMRALFREADLEWAEVTSPQILVLPVFTDGAGTRAWQNTNPFIQIWREAAMQSDGLLRFTLLEANLANERQIKAEKIRAADKASLQKAALRAGAEQILWVSAVVQVEEGIPQLGLRAILFDKDGGVIARVANRIFDGAEADYRSEMTQFQSDVTAKLEQSWQKANVRRQGLSNELVAIMNFDNHKDWIAKKAMLQKLPVINNLSTLMMSTKPIIFDNASSEFDTPQATILIEMTGSLDALRYALASVGLSLSYENGQTVIR